MTAVDEDSQADRLRAAVVVQRVECSPHRTPRVQNVIDEYDSAAVNAAFGQLGGQSRTELARVEIVPVHRRIDAADDLVSTHTRFNGGNALGQTLSQRYTARGNAQEQKPFGTLVGFENFVGNACQRTRDLTRVENFGCAHRSPFPASLDGH